MWPAVIDVGRRNLPEKCQPVWDVGEYLGKKKRKKSCNPEDKGRGWDSYRKKTSGPGASPKTPFLRGGDVVFEEKGEMRNK